MAQPLQHQADNTVTIRARAAGGFTFQTLRGAGSHAVVVPLDFCPGSDPDPDYLGRASRIAARLISAAPRAPAHIRLGVSRTLADLRLTVVGCLIVADALRALSENMAENGQSSAAEGVRDLAFIVDDFVPLCSQAA